MVPIEIITCPQWGAKKPKQGIKVVPMSNRIIIHHTAGHHPEISHPKDESEGECIRYAQDIQRFHMESRGWIDSGHNFLVCRNGLILQGRWLTVWAIEAGHMVESAHCVGENRQIGIEHEHAGTELMTKEQRNSSARLIAWICWHYDKKKILPLYPHSSYNNTGCPANLIKDIPRIKSLALDILKGAEL